MPSRNVLKYDVSETFYHVYARGNSRGLVYKTVEDYLCFISLFARYLSREAVRDRNGLPYPHMYEKVELLAYCLMPNHFHLLIYQNEEGCMKTFMQSLMTSYSRYFNKKYKRSGSLFETRYKAAAIFDERYLEHISRYIHLNPRDWEDYPYSSIRHYTKGKEDEWLAPQKIMQMFSGQQEYFEFVQDYESHKRMLELVKRELAGS